MAKKLALIYDVDPSKAYLCGLLHDFYKYEDLSFLESKLKTLEDINACHKNNVLYHSYASSEALYDIFKIDDNEMKSAIKYHVYGKLNMTRLEEIILIADYTEEGRKYKDCIKCRKTLFEKGINEAILESSLNIIKDLKKQGIEPDPIQYEIVKEYERKILNEKN